MSKILFGCLLFLIIGCTSLEKERSEKKVFRFNLEQSPSSLDPAFARSQNNCWLVNMLFNGLLQLDDSLRVSPAIAKDYTISEDGKTYTFHLRKDVFFHNDECFPNGTARRVTAQDFVYSFYRLTGPKTASAGAWIFNGKIEEKNAFVALNDSTLELNLSKNVPILPELLTTQYCSVIPFEAVEYYGNEFRNHPIGTGPFKFKYWKEGEVLVLLKNEHYWEYDNGKSLPHLDAVKISFTADKQTAFMNFLKGQLDFFNGIDGSFRDEILTKSGRLQNDYQKQFQMVKNPYLNTEYLGILMDKSLPEMQDTPLNDLRFRQAINYAIDRKTLVKHLRNGIGDADVQGMIPHGMPYLNFNAVKRVVYNPEKSIELLKSMGYDGNNKPPKITLYTSSAYRDIIEFIQNELQKVNIDCKIEVQAGASLREMITQNKIPFFRLSWIADYPDAETYMSLFYSKNKAPDGPNYTLYDNARFDALYTKAEQETNPQIRAKYYEEMDNLIMESVPAVVLFYDQAVNFYQNNINGIHPNSLNLLNLKFIDIQN